MTPAFKLQLQQFFKPALLPSILLLYSSMSTLLTLPAQASELPGGALTIFKSDIVWNRANRTSDSTVTVTNTSAANIAAPLVLTVKEITPAGIFVANKSGVDADNNAQVPAYLSMGVLRPGASVDVLLIFTNPKQLTFDYSVSAEGVKIKDNFAPRIRALPAWDVYQRR